MAYRKILVPLLGNERDAHVLTRRSASPRRSAATSRAFTSNRTLLKSCPIWAKGFRPA
jgi:hypothetical protein